MTYNAGMAKWWRPVRVDQLVEGDLVRLAVPAFGHVLIAPRVVSGQGDTAIYEIQVGAHEWRDAVEAVNEGPTPASVRDSFLIARFAFEAVEVWRDEALPPSLR